MAEESFSKATSETAAWQTAASKQSSFEDSSLEEETFNTAASKKAASERHFASAWQLSLAALQTRPSTPELSQLKRRALHTELAELGRPALTTELAQLQTSSFEESSFEASILLGGGRLETSSRRGGVLRELDLELDSACVHHLDGSSFATLLEKACCSLVA